MEGKNKHDDMERNNKKNKQKHIKIKNWECAKSYFIISGTAVKKDQQETR